MYIQNNKNGPQKRRGTPTQYSLREDKKMSELNNNKISDEALENVTGGIGLQDAETNPTTPINDNTMEKI